MLLSPPIVVYSPRVLPVYVYDAHADCGKNVRFVGIFLFNRMSHFVFFYFMNADSFVCLSAFFYFYFYFIGLH